MVEDKKSLRKKFLVELNKEHFNQEKKNEHEVGHLREENQQLKSRVKELEQEVIETVQEWRDEIIPANDKIGNLQNENDQLKERVEELENEIDTHFAGEMGEFNEFKQLQAELEQANKENEKLRGENCSLRAIQDIQNQMENQKYFLKVLNERDTFQKELEQVKKERDGWEFKADAKELSELLADVKGWKAEIHKYRNPIAEFEIPNGESCVFEINGVQRKCPAHYYYDRRGGCGIFIPNPKEQHIKCNDCLKHSKDKSLRVIVVEGEKE